MAPASGPSPSTPPSPQSPSATSPCSSTSSSPARRSASPTSSSPSTTTPRPSAPPSSLSARRPPPHQYALQITCSKEDQPLGTAGPLSLVKDQLQKDNPEGLFFMFNSDIICDYNLKALLAQHRDKGAQATIYLTEVKEPSRFGVVVTDERGCVSRFVEKPQVFVSNLINAGAYLLSTSVLPRIPNRFCMIEKQIFPALAAEGKLFSVVLPGFWNDVGIPSDFLDGQAKYITFLKQKGQLPEGSNLSLIDPSAIIEPEAEIGPMAVIGPGCIVRSGARVRGSCVMAGTEVGKGALVVGSIIGPKNKLGKYSRAISLTVTGSDVTVDQQVQLIGALVCPQKGVSASILEKGKVVL